MQELQKKARLLKQQQQQLADQLQELSKEAEQLDQDEKQKLQAELKTHVSQVRLFALTSARRQHIFDTSLSVTCHRVLSCCLAGVWRCRLA